MPSHIMELVGSQSVATLKALACDTRLNILALLADRDMNINEIGHALKLSQPNVSKHIQILEEAGLIASDYSAAAQGTQKRCHRVIDRVFLSFEDPSRRTENIDEVEMPLGLYSSATPQPTCGIASRESFIGLLDEPLAFHFPERVKAEILWMSAGYVEYMFANTVPPVTEVKAVELVMELCSEAPGFNEDYPSDVTVWINGVEIGTWTSPGDLGGKRGRLNPDWWSDSDTQCGFLKVWTVDDKGCFVDGMKVSDTSITELNVLSWDAATVRIGIKPESPHQGGFTLFGRGFGNYEQGLTLRLRHSGPPRR